MSDQKEYHKQYYKLNKEKIKEKQKEYVLKNKESLKEWRHQRYLKNKEVVKLNRQIYRHNNKEKQKEYIQKNITGIRSYQKKYHKSYYVNNKKTAIARANSYYEKEKSGKILEYRIKNDAKIKEYQRLYRLRGKNGK